MSFPRLPCIDFPKTSPYRLEVSSLGSRDEIALKIPALVEPLSVGWHAVKVSPFKKGDAVLIIGGGPIGIAVMLALQAKGADKIIVSEVSRKRQEYAKNFGAHYILDPTKDDVVKRCRELCDGQGVHVVFDCAGVQAALDSAIEATRARGTIVNVAIWEKPCTITPNLFTFKERRYMGVATFQVGDFQEVIVSSLPLFLRSPTRDCGRAIARRQMSSIQRPSASRCSKQSAANGRQEAISAGSMKPERMITARIGLNEVEEKGFKTLINDKDNQVKILVKVGGDD